MNINLTLFGQMISFAVFVWFTMKFIWPPIVAAMEERKTTIADGLAAAERGHREQALAEERATDRLREAKTQMAEIVAKAEKRGSEIVDEAKENARGEGARLMAAAQQDVEQEANRAREQLREQVGLLALAAAEKILGREIDAAAHRDIVDAFAKQL